MMTAPLARLVDLGLQMRHFGTQGNDRGSESNSSSTEAKSLVCAMSRAIVLFWGGGKIPKGFNPPYAL